MTDASFADLTHAIAGGADDPPERWVPHVFARKIAGLILSGEFAEHLADVPPEALGLRQATGDDLFDGLWCDTSHLYVRQAVSS